MIIYNEKNTETGIKKWAIDLSFIEENTDTFGSFILSENSFVSEDLSLFAEYYPTFILSAGDPYRKWGSQAICRNCRDLYVFDNKMRCCNCGNTPLEIKKNLKLMIMVRIPVLVGEEFSDGSFSGRFFYSFLKEQAQSNLRIRELVNHFFIKNEKGRVYFAPPVRCYLPEYYNSVQPLIYVDKTYFRLLNIPVTHVYPMYNNLCLYFIWRRPLLLEVFTSRVIPRITIDVILSSLQYMGCLNEALRKMRTNFHDVYNLIGKPAYAEFVESVLDQYGDV